MAEIESNGKTVGGLREPHPQEGQVRSQNARRVARRRQAAALAGEVARTEGSDLDRYGDRRKVGGRFERLQAVPERKRPDRAGLNLNDLSSFLSAFNFDAKEETLGQNQFLTSFGPYVLGLNN